MTTPAHILTKVRFLLNLGNSPNPNEAAAAKAAADKLIAKYNITPEELESTKDQPSSYNNDALLFKTFKIVGWMQHLSLACAKQFYCHIVVESITPSDGMSEYSYFIYGEDEDVFYVKFAFNTFLKKINDLLDTRCFGRGPIYQDSYCEGCVEAIKGQLDSLGIEIPEQKQVARPLQTQDKILNNGTANLATQKDFKQKPEKETINVSEHSLIKDVNAYFRGLEDGSRLSLQDILEIEAENEQAAQLQNSDEL